MKYPYSVFQTESEGHVYWIAKSHYLKGCVGQGDTQDEAVDELVENENVWLETAKELNMPVPEIPIIHVSDYSGKVTLRMSPGVHRDAAQYAKSEGISLNQYINNALISQNAKMAMAQ